jgi:hypothetical protein
MAEPSVSQQTNPILAIESQFNALDKLIMEIYKSINQFLRVTGFLFIFIL